MALLAMEVVMAVCCGFFAGWTGSGWLGPAVPRRWCAAGCALGFAPLPALGQGCAAGAVVVWWLVCLALADCSVRLLPNVLTLPGAAVVLAASAFVGRGGPAFLGALCFAGLYAVIHFVSPKSMGAGDVKLAFGLGALCAAVQPAAVLLVALLSSLISGVAAIAVLLWRRRAPPVGVAHGASMCLAAYAVLALCSV
ncbi:prepilin peptidase [Segniliparus rugosus]|uniref:Prepilin type IV endopeptidase peptidase domain-containing protein n=1 Tax=Segniliparus rugosus (strain ATCC BAA-974 / DSM 45345 / CCUG 50838 / CIP 108380 / JCM 13579 / CDC 945) TaxID=679197 RepID=E5XSL1_SEGRC|nr:A24 family peptidase [Segniliparus rugosus]EFV12688.1 hypothetical protein HMPREF9336_02483 [Segniliparus rugosus ATCC BAA-974]